MLHVYYASCLLCFMFTMLHVYYASCLLCFMFTMLHVYYASCLLCFMFINTESKSINLRFELHFVCVLSENIFNIVFLDI